MTDAAHLLSDVGGFAVAIFAAHYAGKRSQQSHTFGYAVTGRMNKVTRTFTLTSSPTKQHGQNSASFCAFVTAFLAWLHALR